jgi:hypothetical protein
MEQQTKVDYEFLLDRLYNKLGTTAKKEVSRLDYYYILIRSLLRLVILTVIELFF